MIHDLSANSFNGSLINNKNIFFFMVLDNKLVTRTIKVRENIPIKWAPNFTKIELWNRTMSGYTPVARGAENTLEYRLFYQNADGQVIR